MWLPVFLILSVSGGTGSLPSSMQQRRDGPITTRVWPRYSPFNNYSIKIHTVGYPQNNGWHNEKIGNRGNPVPNKMKGDGRNAGDIVFPDRPKSFIPNIKKTGANATRDENYILVDRYDEYPAGYIEDILKNEAADYTKFFVDVEKIITTRLNEKSDDKNGEEPICPSEEAIIYPKIGQNADQQVLYIINTERNKQGIRVEKCLKKEESCQLSAAIPSGYRTYCKQKFIYRKLLSLQPDGKAMPDNFRIPSCCSCYYTKTPTF